MSQGQFLFVPDTVPPKMFMFIGFFLARGISGRDDALDLQDMSHAAPSPPQQGMTSGR